MENVNIKRIAVTRKSLYLYWLTFLKPYHKLRQQEIETMALFLYYRYQLSEEVSNQDLVDKLLFSADTKKSIMQDLNISNNYVFNNLLSTLRKKGVITKDNKINPVLIPSISKDSLNFKLIFNFELKDDTK